MLAVQKSRPPKSNLVRVAIVRDIPPAPVANTYGRVKKHHLDILCLLPLPDTEVRLKVLLFELPEVCNKCILLNAARALVVDLITQTRHGHGILGNAETHGHKPTLKLVVRDEAVIVGIQEAEEAVQVLTPKV